MDVVVSSLTAMQ